MSCDRFSFMLSATALALLTSSAQAAAISARLRSLAWAAARARSSLRDVSFEADLASAARSLTFSACAARSARRALRSSRMEARRRCWAMYLLWGPACKLTPWDERECMEDMLLRREDAALSFRRLWFVGG